MPRARLGGSSGVSSTTETDSGTDSTDSESSTSEQRETGSVSTTDGRQPSNPAGSTPDDGGNGGYADPGDVGADDPTASEPFEPDPGPGDGGDGDGDGDGGGGDGDGSDGGDDGDGGGYADPGDVGADDPTASEPFEPDPGDGGGDTEGGDGGDGGGYADPGDVGADDPTASEPFDPDPGDGDTSQAADSPDRDPGGDPGDVSTPEDAQQDVSRQVTEQYSWADRGEDFEVVQQDGEYIAQFTERGREVSRLNAAEEQVADQYPFLTYGEDYTVGLTDSGGVDVTFTASGREKIAEQEQDLRAAAAVATSGSGELSRGIDATDFEEFQPEVEAVERQMAERLPGLDRGDDYQVEITEEGRVTASLTEEGQEAMRETEQLLQEGASAATSGSGELARGVEAFEAGETAQEAERRAEDVRQRFRRGNYGDPREIISEQVAERKTEDYGFDVQPSDITVERTNDGFDVGIESDIAQAGAMAQEAESTLDGGVEVTRTGENNFDVSVSQGFGVDDDLERGLESDLDQAVDEPAEPETGEQFGDIDWSFGLGGPGDEVEQFVDTGGELSQDITSSARNIAGGFGAGVASVGTAPLRVPGMTLEAVETGTYVASGDSTERTVEVIGEANQRIGRATSYYLQNPVEGGTVLAGSLLASYSAMAGAARFGGPRTAAATRYAIQPGEELAKTAARGGLISPDTATAVPGVRDRTAAPEQAFGRARDTATDWFDTASDRVPARSDLSNRIRREIQRYRYQRPPERDTPRIDLADEDDVDAVYVQDFRADADDADADPLADVETDVEGDASNVGSMGTTFDGPAVEVDAGGGQRMLLRTRQETRAEMEARLRADTETDARTETELRGRVEPSVPTEATSEVAEQALGEGVEPIGRVQLGTETETGVDFLREAQAREVSAETETAVTAEPVFATATEVGLRSEQTGRVQGAREAVRETETEVELLGEPRTEAPTEAESDPGPDDDGGGETDDNQLGFGKTAARENVPGAGWFNVFATALAGGGIEARSDPENIDALADDELGVSLPTQGQVDPSEELAEGYEAVESLFFLDDGSDDGGTGGSAEADDDWGWF